jgi:hypothetical protein
VWTWRMKSSNWLRTGRFVRLTGWHLRLECKTAGIIARLSGVWPDSFDGRRVT